MSLGFGVAGDAQLATGVAGAAWLIELDFDLIGTQYLTTAPVDVLAAGHTYRGLGDNVKVGMVSESEDTSARQVVISFAVTNSVLLANVLAGISAYRNRRVRLYLQLFDAQFAPVLSRVHRWTGRMDPVRIPRKAQDQGPSTGRIELPCTRSGMPYARAHQGLRHTHAQQIARYPGNLCLQYLQDLIDKPSLWLSKRFQELGP